LNNLLMILTIGAATWLARAGGFYFARRSFPPIIDRFLSWVPVAAFAALAAPGLIDGPGATSSRLLGALATTVVVSRAGPYWAALLAGMGVFWLLSAIV
jgi:branched-subunit amino acid transport protein